jgi:hypothetical protein
MTERLDELLDRYLLDEATRAERIELIGLLRDSPDHRRRLVQRVTLESHLYRACGERLRSAEPGLTAQPVAMVDGPIPMALAAPGVPNGRSTRMRWPIAWRLAAAAVVLLAVGLSAWLAIQRWQQPPVVATGVAVQSGQVQIRRADGSFAPASAGDVPTGATLRATSDKPAALRLGDGSVVTLAPAAQAIFRGGSGELRQVVELSAGSADFSVPAGKGTFRVDTPGGNVVVLGTEFTVRLPPPPPADRPPMGPPVVPPDRRPERPREADRPPGDREEGRRGDPRRDDGERVPVEPVHDAEGREPPGRDREWDRPPPPLDPARSGPPVVVRPALYVAVRSGRVRVERGERQYELSAGQARLFRGNGMPPAEGATMESVVGGVDPVERTIRLRRPGDGGPRLDLYRLHDDAVIEVDGQPAGPSALLPEMNVRVRRSIYAADEIVRIEARGRDVTGTVASVDLSARTVQIARLREGDTIRPIFALATDAQVLIEGRSTVLAELQPGMKVTLRLSTDGRLVRQVEVPRKPVRERGESR